MLWLYIYCSSLDYTVLYILGILGIPILQILHISYTVYCLASRQLSDRMSSYRINEECCMRASTESHQGASGMDGAEWPWIKAVCSCMHAGTAVTVMRHHRLFSAWARNTRAACSLKQPAAEKGERRATDQSMTPRLINFASDDDECWIDELTSLLYEACVRWCHRYYVCSKVVALGWHLSSAVTSAARVFRTIGG